MRTVTALVVFALFISSAPLAAGAASPPADPLAGYWTGTWEREGARLEVAFTFTPVASGGYAATFDSEQLRAVGVPLSDVALSAPAVAWKIVGDTTTSLFVGKLSADHLAGTFRDGKAEGTFSLQRAARPTPPREEEVVFHDGDVALAGTILLPAGVGPHPAVVFLHGSGAEGRWASRFLATRFAERGVAALIYDKRGVGASTGDWRSAGLEELAADASAAVATLRQRPDIAAQKVGIHGHSQGGTLTAMVAEKVRDLAFVVGSAACGLPPAECEEYSVGNAIGLPEMSGAEATVAHAFVRALVAHAYGGAPRETATVAWQAVRERPWAFEPPPEDDPYWTFSRRIASFDPPAHWRHVRSPVLLVYGEIDERVPGRKSAGAITAALIAGGDSDIAVRFFPGADHTFRVTSESESGFAWPHSAPGYPQAVIDWVLAIVGGG
jgi:dipeptidyl aminopeptidase/acylaminoacyl peptidase